MTQDNLKFKLKKNLRSDMTNRTLNLELDTLKATEQLADWTVTLGYGEAEYTLDFNHNAKIDVKLLAKKMQKVYGAKNLTKHVNGSSVAIKFVVDL